MKLKFGKGNAKLGKHVATFSLPSGFTCPKAKECLSRADKVTGKITDGKETVFRCYSASQEALYPGTRKARWHNFDLLRKENKRGMEELINSSLPNKSKLIRIHVAGDFFSEDYLMAWINVAKNNPDKTFYCYTKRISLFQKHEKSFPANFIYTFSYGGKEDNLIRKKDKSVQVFYSPNETKLPVDHDDTLAQKKNPKKFALIIHGIQPKGKKRALAKYNKVDGFKISLPLVGGDI